MGCLFCLYFYSVKICLCLVTAIAIFLLACNFQEKKKSKVNFPYNFIPSTVKDSFYIDRENVFTIEKAALGRYLFYDRRLSVNNTKACASCHAQQFSFTDSYTKSIGALGDLHQRNARPLINIIFNKYLTSADSMLHFPEQQINNPMMNEHPIEMGIKGTEEKILKKLKADKFYQQKFKTVFAEEINPFTIKNIQHCIASFIKTIFSFNSSYDKGTLSAEQQNGKRLFFSDKLNCGSCHGGINFSTPSFKNSNGETDFYFNTGLYNINGSYPANDRGFFDKTGNVADNGKIRVPTLRNLAFTAPYFHDGSAATLEDVLKVYMEGGRNITTGINKGDGRSNPHKNFLIKGFTLNLQEQKDVISFLFALSDSSIINNPAYANPFTDDETKR